MSTKLAADIATLKTQVAELAVSVAAALTKIDPGDSVVSLSIKQFCKRNNISDRQYFKLAAQGRGPRVMRTGGRKGVRISREAETDWVREREAEREAERTEATE